MQPDVGEGAGCGDDGWEGSTFGPLAAQVSVFLAGFSGLYFTVGAVTDETYRQQFFTSVTRELERAVAVRAVYRDAARAEPATQARPLRGDGEGVQVGYDLRRRGPSRPGRRSCRPRTGRRWPPRPCRRSPAPRVMISSEELASTGSSPATREGHLGVELAGRLGDDRGGTGVQSDGRADGDGLAGHRFSLAGVMVGAVGLRPTCARSSIVLRALGQALQGDDRGGADERPPRRGRPGSRRMLPTAKSTKIPPCGARTLTSSAIDSPPVTALPSMIAGITRSGSAAANGIAPSVMNEAPSSQAGLAVLALGQGEQVRADDGGQAPARSAGTMPASITAAMIFSCGASAASAAAPRRRRRRSCRRPCSAGRPCRRPSSGRG